MFTNINHLQYQYRLSIEEFNPSSKGGGRMQSHPSLSKLIQDQPFYLRELELGIFIFILVLILLSCVTTPPIIILEKSGTPARVFVGKIAVRTITVMQCLKYYPRSDIYFLTESRRGNQYLRTQERGIN